MEVTTSECDRADAARPAFWDSFINPDRNIEAMAWVRQSPSEVIAARGSMGETALHWAAVTNLALMVDLITAGLPVNTQDASGKTPLDWQVDQAFAVCVDRQGDLRDGGRYHVRSLSESLAQAIWRLGGRPGPRRTMDPIQVWSRAGMWSLLDMRVEMEGPQALKNLGRARESALHGWMLAPDAPEKYRCQEKWLAQGWLAVDEPDANGRTPMWYAVKAWRERPHWMAILRPSMDALLVAGADPRRVDAAGVSPIAMAQPVAAPGDAASFSASDHAALLAAIDRG